MLKRAGYTPALNGCKTTLKQGKKGTECLSSAFDNIFYNRNSFTLLSAGVIPFHEDFVDLRAARMISDHLPVFMEFDVNEKD